MQTIMFNETNSKYVEATIKEINEDLANKNTYEKIQEVLDRQGSISVREVYRIINNDIGFDLLPTGPHLDLVGYDSIDCLLPLKIGGIENE